MNLNKQRAIILIVSLVLTFIVLRVSLYLSPTSNFNIGTYNIHHLFTGLLLISIGGIPLILFKGDNKLLKISTVFFGVGLSMALDEWVYLIATDGSDISYLLPISLWGAVVMLGLSCLYILILFFSAKK